MASSRPKKIIRPKDPITGIKLKTYLQARYMLMSLAEAHKIFVEENEDCGIGVIKFCELRPQNVKLFDEIPHKLCVCIPCELHGIVLLTALKLNNNIFG